MNYIYLVVIIWLRWAKCTLDRDIPSYVSLCNRNDPELSKCLINSIKKIRPYLLKGIPEMDIPPGDPLHYFDASASTGQGSVRLAAKAWNQTAIGFMNFDIKNISIDFEQSKFLITIYFPKTRLLGQYQFKGKVLLFEIDTIGYFELNITNILANAVCLGRYYVKKSKQYIEFDEINLNVAIDTAEVYFSNLINGNEELTRTVNNAVNENINGLIDELRPVIGQTFGGIVRLYFNSVFRLFPVDVLFPNN